MRVLLESYYYLFYRLWRWHRKHFGESDLPHLNATLNLGILAVLNWMTFLMGFRVIFGFELVDFGRAEGTIAVVTIGIIMFAIFFRGGRFKQIIARFQDKDLQTERVVRVLSTAYPIITFVLLILAAFFTWGINNQ